MATASTGILFNATAINKTGRVFRQITQSALAVGKKIATIGAGFAVGGAAAIAATAKSLGHLSDVAMQAGVSTAEITKMSTAMDVLGIKSSTPEQLAMAFQRMAKTTGETGVAGFEKVIGAISEMGTVEERASAAMAVFGKSGMDFLPLIEGAAKNGTAALHDVIAAMPGVSQAAAEAGDALADGMKVMGDGIKSVWYEGIAKVVNLINSRFAGGVREAAMKGAAWMRYFASVAGRYVTTFFKSWSETSGGVLAGFVNVLHNCLEIMKGVIKAAFESLVSSVQPIANKLVEMFAVSAVFIKEGKQAAVDYLKEWEKNNVQAGQTMRPWEDLAKKVRDLKWLPDGTKVDTSDLYNKLLADMKAAEKGAAAIGKAAVGIAGKGAADETAKQIQSAVRAAKTDLLTADTYRAATMSIRADYGKGEDKTVRAVNAVKSVNEKIQKATESTAAALSNLEMV